MPDDTKIAERLQAHLLHYANEVERAHRIILEAADLCQLAKPFTVEELAMVSATVRSFERTLRGYSSGLEALSVTDES